MTSELCNSCSDDHNRNVTFNDDGLVASQDAEVTDGLNTIQKPSLIARMNQMTLVDQSLNLEVISTGRLNSETFSNS